jgi:carbamoyl-phosphate synthase large subunit
LIQAFALAKEVSEEHPLYVDRFLPDAVEFDIDGICDGERAWIGGVMEHVEEAGIHSGDSSCVIPPLRLPPAKIDEMAGLAKKIAVRMGVKGLFNIQMAVVQDRVYVLEANPRASRTIPFLAKATGYPMIRWAIQAALGTSVKDVVASELIPGNYRLPSHGYAVKTPVFPFAKFRGFDPVLGPEMRSTGEVMGMDSTPGAAFAKAFFAAGIALPNSGRVLLSFRDQDKPRAMAISRIFEILGFEIIGTPGTADYLKRAGIKCSSIPKIGQAPLGEDLLSLLQTGNIKLVVNTTSALVSLRDAVTIRSAALNLRIPLLSTIEAAEMALMAIQTLKRDGSLTPLCLQDFLRRVDASSSEAFANPDALKKNSAAATKSVLSV